MARFPTAAGVETFQQPQHSENVAWLRDVASVIPPLRGHAAPSLSESIRRLYTRGTEGLQRAEFAFGPPRQAGRCVGAGLQRLLPVVFAGRPVELQGHPTIRSPRQTSFSKVPGLQLSHKANKDAEKP